MKKGVLIALTNAVPGREDEFNEWYNKVHLVDVLKIPGIVGAKRFKLAPGQHVQGTKPWQYAATYDLETNDMGSIASELKRRRGPDGKGTPEMNISSSLQEERLAWFFEEIYDYHPKK